MSFRTVLDKFDSAASWLQSPLLLVLRLYWGISFAQTGWGKFMNLDRTASFFGDIGIPAPKLNAIAAASIELVCGVLLAIGLVSRVAALLLATVMAVAYATAHREELTKIISETDAFTGAAPFLFLMVTLIVLAFGPGKISVDYLWRGKAKA